MQLSVREIQSIMVSTPEEDGLKEASGEDNNIIIPLYTNLFACVSVSYLPKSCIRHYYHGASFFSNLKTKAVMYKTKYLVKRSVVYLRQI